jgi:FMN phosphatase YigB (HAD superfamily)
MNSIFHLARFLNRLFLYGMPAVFLIMQTSLFSLAGSAQDASVAGIESMTQIAGSQPAGTIYFFDIDDTIFDSPCMLGSKAWRKYIAEATKNDFTHNWRDVLSLFLARNHPVETVESITSQFVQKLQMEGYAVFGLTARERKRWYDTPTDGIDLLTANQLESVGINFSNTFIDEAYPYSCLTDDPEYFNGIFFADVESKGEYLLKLFKNAPQLPEKVIFIDDKKSQVESVAAALNQLGIIYECYWYSATDKKAGRFDPLVANIQLYYFWLSGGTRALSDAEAASIAEQYPERNAEYYLQLLMHCLVSWVNSPQLAAGVFIH